MKHLTLVAATFAAVAALAGTAAADKLQDADRTHDFHSVDRLTPVSTFGLAIGYEVWDDDSAIDTILGIDLSGHFVTPSGAGAYLTLPVSYISTDDVDFGPIQIDGDTETVIGNIELGGLYARPLGKRADFVVHLGIALPTADDDVDVGLLQPYASVPRYGDLVNRWPNSTWLRLGFSPMGTFGPFFWRGDIGVDLMIADEDEETGQLSPVLRLNGAAGVDLGVADITAELATNVTNPDDDDAADDDEIGSTLAIGARFDGGNVQPGIALVLPVGFDNDNGVEDGVEQLDFAIALSVTARMP